MAKNIIEKIWDEHIVTQKPGHPAILGIDLQLIHEVTSPQGFKMLDDKGLSVKYPSKNLATLDHSIPTRKDRENIYDPIAKKQVDALRENTKNKGIPIYDFESGNQGIVHIIGPELGITQPGMTIVCGDSHTSTHGAFGAMAFGIGSTEVGFTLASGCILQNKPKTMKVVFDGQFQKGVYSKDAILALIAKIGIGGANGHIIEYTGSAVKSMSMEARMSMCNMSIECGARAGIVSPDDTTFSYIMGRKYAPKESEWNKAIKYWSSFVSDEGAKYDKEVYIDISKLEPMVTWGINPSEGIMISKSIPTSQDIDKENQNNYQKSLEYVKLEGGKKIEGTPIQWSFIGSCTNARMEDLRIVANVFYPDYKKDTEIDLNKVRKVHPSVTCYIVPGSESVKAQAENEGLDQIFTAAGADWRMPGCSMCLGMNDDKVPAGERCISTSNRNFMNRQGPGAITHLASPATAAISAVYGKISDIRKG